MYFIVTAYVNQCAMISGPLKEETALSIVETYMMLGYSASVRPYHENKD